MGYVATIGMFDGVHRGHQYVLRQVVETARERGMQSLVVTFDHLLRKDAVLTTLDEKRQLIGSMGVDRTEVLAFTDELRQMTARQFMERVLRDQLDVKVLLTGYDNRFGHRREEGFNDYVRHGQELGIEVHQLRAEGTVSSSHIRQLLQRGNVAEAAHCLGRCYTLSGHVEHGEHVGTQLGFPTANLHPDCDRQLIPAAGVYAVRAHIAAGVYDGMMNIGSRPTFDGHRQTLEAHLFGLNADLYGSSMQIEFVERLRSERRFDNAEALREQLLQDAKKAKTINNNQ